VKTLNPKIHGGLLALRGNPAHMKTIGVHGIVPFDMLVETSTLRGDDRAAPAARGEAIENIDIGGLRCCGPPRKTRSRSRWCATPGLPSSRGAEEDRGNLDEETMRELGRKAFAMTARMTLRSRTTSARDRGGWSRSP